MVKSTGSYNTSFYDDITYNSAKSAALIVPFLSKLLSPKSVVDIGCGSGAWLKQFETAGVGQLLGMDGPWVSKDHFQVSYDHFSSVDISQGLKISGNFDLAVCLETMEHVAAEKADGILKEITSVSPVVLFSAAVPEQGGVGHVNEQWHAYWIGKFAALDYQLFDIIRPEFWNDTRVSFWFAQNMMLFVRKSHLRANPELGAKLLALPSFGGANLVHPKLYNATLDRLAYSRSLFGAFKQVIRNVFRLPTSTPQP